MLDKNLFPPELVVKVNDNFGKKEAGYLRQVAFSFDDDPIVVINSSRKDDTWTSPSFVLLRGVIQHDEITTIQEIMEYAHDIFDELVLPETTQESMTTFMSVIAKKIGASNVVT